MIKYFIFTFLFIWIVLTFIFFQNYKNTSEQYHLNEYNKLLEHYDIAMELAGSKLNNVHLQNFSGHNLTHLLENILKQKTIQTEKLLDNILLNKINHQKYAYDNIIFYNKNGEQIYSLINKNRIKSYSNDFLKKISSRHEVLFESVDNNINNFLIVSPIFSQENNIIGYIEKTISFKNFIYHFFHNLPYQVSVIDKNINKKVQMEEKKDYYYINIYPYNKNTTYTLSFLLDDPSTFKERINFFRKSFFTFFGLFIFFYMLYGRFKSIENLKKVGYFMENSNDQLLILSQNNNQIEYVNSTFIKNIGYSKKELIGKKVNLFVKDENIERYLSNIENKTDYFKIEFTRKDNSIYHVDIHIKKLDMDKRVYMCIAKDISKEEDLLSKIELQKEFFKTIIESSPSGIFVKNHSGKYILVNDAMAKIFNMENKEALLNKTNTDIGLSPILCESFTKDEKKTLESLTIHYKDVQKIKDKYYKIIMLPLNNYLYPTNEKMLLGFATDITTEVAKKNELSKLNTRLKIEILDEIKDKINIDEKFKTIFDNIHDAMFVYNINEKGELTKLVSKNKAAKEFMQTYGFEKKNPNSIFEKISFSYDKKENPTDITHQTFTKKLKINNIEHIVKIDAQLIEIAKEFKVIIFVQNIDEKVKLKKEKREQQILIANIFKKAKAGIAIIDKNGKLIKYNHSFYKTLGYKRNEFRKQNFYLIAPKEYQKTIREEHNELFINKKEISREYIFISKDKKEISVFASSTLIKDGFEQTFRLLIFEDITKLKELELEQIKNSKIIAQQAKMAEMGEMIGAIAHQWRQPLNAINAAAMNLNFASKLNMLQESDLIEKTQFIEKQSIKMSETINDFMNFFKPSKNKSTFTLEDIYDNICEFIDPQLKNRNIELSLKCDHEIKIYGFKNEFEHILLNLVNNAKDAFENSNINNKFIKVLGETTENKIIIKVVDNAGGIPNSILNKIFNPYFTTKEQGKGTGIGLYMTKTIIEQHFKGQIEVSNIEDGAMFTITLNME